jgi:predicted PurR-regulated permease PerM
VNRPKRISYVFMGLMLVLVGVLHLATPLLTALFSYFALSKLRFGQGKWLGVVLFLILLGAASFGLCWFAQRAYVAAPKIAQATIPAVIEFADRKGLSLPFTDSASAKHLAVEAVKSKILGVGAYARNAAVQLVSFVIGVVVAISLFFGKGKALAAPAVDGDNLYAASVREIMERFSSFYASFGQVMGAQIFISVINTGVTAVFLLLNGYPFTPLIVAFTFLCGLLPIIGNLISNTLIVSMGFTLSAHTALLAFLFLVALHKLEYFLNSKIVGKRIQNPMWLTLIGLVLGEKLMGVPGMILAPAVLHYVKVEMSKNKLE